MNSVGALEADLRLDRKMGIEERIAALKSSARMLEQAFPHDLRAHVVVACGPNRRIVSAVFRWPGVVVVSDPTGRVIARSQPGRPDEIDWDSIS